MARSRLSGAGDGGGGVGGGDGGAGSADLEGDAQASCIVLSKIVTPCSGSSPVEATKSRQAESAVGAHRDLNKSAHHGATSSKAKNGQIDRLREPPSAGASLLVNEAHASMVVRPHRAGRTLRTAPSGIATTHVKLGTQAWNNYDANTPHRSKSPSTTPRRTPRLEQKHSHLHPAASATAMRSNSPRPLAKRNDKATNQAKAATQRKAATISIERVAAMERAFQAKSAEARAAAERAEEQRMALLEEQRLRAEESQAAAEEQRLREKAAIAAAAREARLAAEQQRAAAAAERKAANAERKRAAEEAQAIHLTALQPFIKTSSLTLHKGNTSSVAEESFNPRKALVEAERRAIRKREVEISERNAGLENYGATRATRKGPPSLPWQACRANTSGFGSNEPDSQGIGVHRRTWTRRLMLEARRLTIRMRLGTRIRLRPCMQQRQRP